MRNLRWTGTALTLSLSVALVHCGGSDKTNLFSSEEDAGIAIGDAQADATVDVVDSAVDVVDSAIADRASTPLNRCPAAHGPAMAELPTTDGGTFCIDTTEVTNAQYAEFLTQTNGHYSVPHCVDDHSGIPGLFCQYDPILRANYPLVCVSWCNAAAYCSWAGKRLCGKIGGGASAPGDFDNPASSQWYAACSMNGAHVEPYGDVQDTRCNSYGYHDGGVSVEPVGAAKDCHALTPPFSSLLDMTGNVAEWEDSCEEGGACLYRGGSYVDNLGAVCGASGYIKRDQPPPRRSPESSDNTIGFRCCAD